MRSGTVLCSLCGVVLIVPFHGSLEIFRGAESTEQFWSLLSECVRAVRGVGSSDPAGKGQTSSQSQGSGLKHCCVLCLWSGSSGGSWARGEGAELTSNPPLCFHRAAACFHRAMEAPELRLPEQCLSLKPIIHQSRVQGTSLLVLPAHQRRAEMWEHLCDLQREAVPR